MIKLHRVFFGGYRADVIRLKAKGYSITRSMRVFTATNINHGRGMIKGTTKKVGANYSPVPVCVFCRDNRQLLWEIKSKADGSYAFRNIAVGLECFIVAFDPNNQFNAVIQDKVIAK